MVWPTVIVRVWIHLDLWLDTVDTINAEQALHFEENAYILTVALGYLPLCAGLGMTAIVTLPAGLLAAAVLPLRAFMRDFLRGAHMDCNVIEVSQVALAALPASSYSETNN